MGVAKKYYAFKIGGVMKKLIVLSIYLSLIFLLVSCGSETGFKEVEGDQTAALQGERGEPGMDGVDGIDGTDGINGKDGVNGQDGNDGRDGIDGLNAVDGMKLLEIWSLESADPIYPSPSHPTNLYEYCVIDYFDIYKYTDDIFEAIVGGYCILDSTPIIIIFF